MPARWYYHANLSRSDAEQLLAQENTEGGFLIRDSATTRGAFSLCLWKAGKMHSYLVIRDASDQLFIKAAEGVEERKYSTLDLLVEDYMARKSANGLAGPLTLPVSSFPKENNDYELEHSIDNTDALTMSFQQHLMRLDLSRLDGDFIIQLKRYVDTQLSQDANRLKEGRTNASLLFFRDLISESMAPLVKELDYFNLKLSVMQELFCGARNSQEYRRIYAILNSSLGGAAPSVHSVLDSMATTAHTYSALEQLMIVTWTGLLQGEDMGLGDLGTSGPTAVGSMTGAPVYVGCQENNNTIIQPPGTSGSSSSTSLATAVKGTSDPLGSSSWTGGVGSGSFKMSSVGEETSAITRLLKSHRPMTYKHTFHVKTPGNMFLQKNVTLVVDLKTGQLMILRQNQHLSDQNCYVEHDKILQLIKSTSSMCLLQIKFSDRKKEGYLFNSSQQRDLFCQLISHTKSFFSKDREPDAISLFVGTWNMGGESNCGDLSQWFKSIGQGKTRLQPLSIIPHDMYVIATQESKYNSEKEWEKTVKQVLEQEFNIKYETVSIFHLWAIRILIVCKSEHANRISNVQTSYFKTGCNNRLGNKGAVAISFNFCATSFCFINAHLTSGAEKNSKREQNYRDILRNLSFGDRRSYPRSCDVNQLFDHVFWIGDLNFRVDEDIDKILTLLEAGNYNRMLIRDQLKASMQTASVFTQFNEADITFPPTYRYERGKRESWSWQKLGRSGNGNTIRTNVPSWCDRVLWKSRQFLHIQNTSYGCNLDYTISDHKPVFSSFQVGVAPEYVHPSSALLHPSALHHPPTSSSTLTSQHCHINFNIDIVTAKIKNGNVKHRYVLQIFGRIIGNKVYQSKPNSRFIPDSDLPSAISGVSSDDVRQSTRPVQSTSTVSREGQEGAESGPIVALWSEPLSAMEINYGVERSQLEESHVIISVSCLDTGESHGSCVVSLKPLIGCRSKQIEERLSLYDEDNGLLLAKCHVTGPPGSGFSVGTLGKKKRKTYDLISFDLRAARKISGANSGSEARRLNDPDFDEDDVDDLDEELEDEKTGGEEDETDSDEDGMEEEGDGRRRNLSETSNSNKSGLVPGQSMGSAFRPVHPASNTQATHEIVKMTASSSPSALRRFLSDQPPTVRPLPTYGPPVHPVHPVPTYPPPPISSSPLSRSGPAAINCQPISSQAPSLQFGPAADPMTLRRQGLVLSSSNAQGLGGGLVCPYSGGTSRHQQQQGTMTVHNEGYQCTADLRGGVPSILRQSDARVDLSQLEASLHRAHSQTVPLQSAPVLPPKRSGHHRPPTTTHQASLATAAASLNHLSNNASCSSSSSTSSTGSAGSNPGTTSTPLDQTPIRGGDNVARLHRSGSETRHSMIIERVLPPVETQDTSVTLCFDKSSSKMASYTADQLLSCTLLPLESTTPCLPPAPVSQASTVLCSPNKDHAQPSLVNTTKPQQNTLDTDIEDVDNTITPTTSPLSKRSWKNRDRSSSIKLFSPSTWLNGTSIFSSTTLTHVKAPKPTIATSTTPLVAKTISSVVTRCTSAVVANGNEMPQFSPPLPARQIKRAATEDVTGSCSDEITPGHSNTVTRAGSISSTRNGGSSKLGSSLFTRLGSSTTMPRKLSTSEKPQQVDLKSPTRGSRRSASPNNSNPAASKESKPTSLTNQSSSLESQASSLGANASNAASLSPPSVRPIKLDSGTPSGNGAYATGNLGNVTGQPLVNGCSKTDYESDDDIERPYASARKVNGRVISQLEPPYKLRDPLTNGLSVKSSPKLPVNQPTMTQQQPLPIDSTPPAIPERKYCKSDVQQLLHDEKPVQGPTSKPQTSPLVNEVPKYSSVKKENGADKVKLEVAKEEVKDTAEIDSIGSVEKESTTVGESTGEQHLRQISDSGSEVEYITLLRPMNLTRWLECLQLPQYVDLFLASKWNALELARSLTYTDLVDLGIDNESHRRQIVNSLHLI